MATSYSMKERLLRAIKARLEEISTSNTPAGGSEPYRFDIKKVTRQYIDLSDIEIGDDPVLSLSPTQVEYAGRTGAANRSRQDEFLTVTIGGLVVESNADIDFEDSTLQTDLIELETDVRRALFSDSKFGGLAVFSTITQSEYDEGLAHPYAWFVLTLDTQFRVRMRDPRLVS